MTATETPTHVATSALYRLALGCYAGLIVLWLAWLIWLDPPPATLRSVMLIVVLLPLLAGLRGVLHRRRYTLQWTGMLILLYFMHGLVAATGGFPARWLGVTEALLAMGYFGATLLVLRRGKQAHKAAQAKTEA